MANFTRRYLSMLAAETALPWARHVPPSPEPLSDPSEKNGATTHMHEIPSDASFAENSPPPKKRRGLEKYWTVVATGAGLFSDGYINNSISFFTKLLTRVYGADALAQSSALSNLSALVFAGTVVGMLFFGFFADHVSRKMGMMISTVILIIFSILAAGAWGIGMPTDPNGMLAALTVYRVLLGIGIGGEYPAGSVACAEASQLMPSGHRNRWFVWFTNYMIDSGYVAAAFIAWVLLYICGVPHDATGTHGMMTVWRVLFGLGAICPLSLFYLRLKFEENEQFRSHNLKRTKTPWWLVIKYYGPRLAVVSAIWFFYDFCSYSFGIYSTQIISIVIKDDDIHKNFGWVTLFNVFYIPGAFLGAIAADYFGPRLTLLFGQGVQGLVGFIMVSYYSNLVKSAAPLVVAYGIFTALGEFGPGDNIGLIASKTSASAVRGRYYGLAAAAGKIGAFVGGYVFPAIANHYGGLSAEEAQRVLLYLSSAICVFSALLSLLLPPLTQSAVNDEDLHFRSYLEANGFDTSLMGDAVPEEEDFRPEK